jgi:hypothetical protein
MRWRMTECCPRPWSSSFNREEPIARADSFPQAPRRLAKHVNDVSIDATVRRPRVCRNPSRSPQDLLFKQRSVAAAGMKKWHHILCQGCQIATRVQ